MDRLALSAQENLLTLLANSNEFGGLVANMVRPELFEGDYQLIAERCIQYWHQHKKAPGAHTADLFAEILEDRGNRRATALRRAIVSMAQLHDAINAQYVMRQLRIFTRLQSLKIAIMSAAEHLQNDPQGNNIERVEQLLSDILRARDTDFEVGTRLSNFRTVLHSNDELSREFDTGIDLLDKNNIVPARGTLFNMLAPSGLGKTWFLVQLGKRAFMRRKKVLHVSLENSEESLMRRYYQALFSVTRHEAEDRIRITTLQEDNAHRLIGFGHDFIDPDFTFDSSSLSAELSKRVKRDEKRMFNVIIKQFPERGLSMNGLRAYLDSLESVIGFVPDLLIVDYPGKMKLDPRNYRISLGMTYSEFRGLLIERNMAGACVHQSSKAGAEARQVKQTHVGEDWSIVQTSDVVLTYSASATERLHGLARLFVSKARDEKDNFGVLLSQSYDIGQFVLSTAFLRNSYFEILDRSFGDQPAPAAEDPEDPEDDD